MLGKLHKAVDAAQAGDCKSATQTIVPMLDGHDPSLPADLLGPIYQVVISCEIRLDRSADAYRHALAGSALENSADDLWRMRVALELDDHRAEAAVMSVETMSQGRGAALNALPVRWFYQLDRRLKEQNLSGLRRRLLTILSANAYVPKDQAPGAADGFRHNLANILFDAGDRAGAAALLADIGSPSELADIFLNPRRWSRSRAICACSVCRKNRWMPSTRCSVSRMAARPTRTRTNISSGGGTASAAAVCSSINMMRQSRRFARAGRNGKVVA
jgi:hypothetical protein